MDHTILYKRKGFYGAFPVLTHLPDGRLTVGIPVAPFHDHYAVADWLVFCCRKMREKRGKKPMIRHFPTIGPEHRRVRYMTGLPP